MGRNRKYNSSRVISIRISDEELKEINILMANSRIDKVSDLMREAIHIFKENLSAELQLVVNRSGQPLYDRLS